MKRHFSKLATAVLDESKRRRKPESASVLRAEMQAADPAFVAKCIEFEEVMGGYSVEGLYNWHLGIDSATLFEHEGSWYVECATLTVSAPFKVYLNSSGQICADVYPMAETFSHFFEREAIANWCRENWSNGQRLRTVDARIEQIIASQPQLRKIPEACDHWETWWMDENQMVAACKFYPWASANTTESNYWIFDTQNSMFGELAARLITQNINFSVDSWAH